MRNFVVAENLGRNKFVDCEYKPVLHGLCTIPLIEKYCGCDRNLRILEQPATISLLHVQLYLLDSKSYCSNNRTTMGLSSLPLLYWWDKVFENLSWANIESNQLSVTFSRWT